MIRRPTTLIAAGLAGFLAAPLALAGSVEDLATTRVASGLRYPLLATYAPGDFKRLYIVEKPGRILVLDLTTGIVSGTPFLDIQSIVRGGTSTNDERGLLGLAFDPEYQKNGYFYVNYTEEPTGATQIARYETVSPDLADSGSRFDILQIGQPFQNHNGGWIGFGPNDGYLYIGTGDGGASGDPGNRAQDITNQLLGKMLRIDVHPKAGTYGIPPDNPFVGIEGDDEIWAYGLRNPWRNDFDRETNDLWIADVGQNDWEEVDVQPSDSPGGENYGWRCREGMHDFNFSGDCFKQEFTEPIHEYPHSCSTGGFSITGGCVYRGCAIPTLRGYYLFADYVCGNIWHMLYDGKTAVVTNIRTDISPSIEGFTVNQVSSFGEDARGEMYIVDQGNGTSGQVFRLIPAVPTIAAEDINCDGVVDTADLLLLLRAWGPCPGCPEDINGDGVADTADLITLLAAWS